MSAPLVEARELGKSYPRVFRRGDRLRALLGLLAGRSSGETTPVLQNIDLTVNPGQSLGLIGDNGAGKSTLLKLLTGVLTPTRGSVRVNGRIGALLELGAGFHPEYSGRDNIAMAATLQGFSADELDTRMADIVAFADIGRYIDEPVKHYSSGMVVRLGFAIVAATRPQLLITDEVLAVGDESFQKKCIRWMEDYLEQGGTLILVSHSMYHIQKLCRQALWLREGCAQAYGDVFEVTQAYLAYHERKSSAETVRARDVEAVRGLEFHARGMRVNGLDAEALPAVEQGAELTVEATIASRDGRVPVVNIGIARADGTPVYGVSSDMDGVQPAPLPDGDFHIVLRFAELPLLPGSYTIRVHPLDSEGMRLFDTLERTLTVRGRSAETGLVRLRHVWEHAAPLCRSRSE